MIPVMKPDNPEQPLIWAGGRAHSRAEVLSAATALAERLPERGHVLNACGTRYGFMVGLLAALLRGQVTVLPGDRSDRAVALLAERYPGLYRLADEAGPGGRLETLDVAPDAPSAPGTPALPEIPAQRVVAIVFTSGSTGEPMPNEKPMGLLETTGRLIARRMGFDQGASAAILTTVPPQHMYGLETSISVRWYQRTGQLAFVDGDDAACIVTTSCVSVKRDCNPLSMRHELCTNRLLHFHSPVTCVFL